MIIQTEDLEFQNLLESLNVKEASSVEEVNSLFKESKAKDFVLIESSEGVIEVQRILKG